MLFDNLTRINSRRRASRILFIFSWIFEAHFFQKIDIFLFIRNSKIQSHFDVLQYIFVVNSLMVLCRIQSQSEYSRDEYAKPYSRRRTPFAVIIMTTNARQLCIAAIILNRSAWWFIIQEEGSIAPPPPPTEALFFLHVFLVFPSLSSRRICTNSITIRWVGRNGEYKKINNVPLN